MHLLPPPKNAPERCPWNTWPVFVCITVLQPVILPLPFLLFVFLHKSCAVFQPPAPSFNHNHWCRYLMSSLHPGKHRPWDISCIISLNDPAPFCLFHHLHRSCRKPVSVCVSVFHLPDSAADTSTCWAQMCPVCRYSHSAICLTRKIIASRGNQWLGRTIWTLHHLCVCVCV